jgi:hypothetical protein
MFDLASRQQALLLRLILNSPSITMLAVSLHVKKQELSTFTLTRTVICTLTHCTCRNELHLFEKFLSSEKLGPSLVFEQCESRISTILCRFACGVGTTKWLQKMDFGTGYFKQFSESIVMMLIGFRGIEHLSRRLRFQLC